mmetsp:Transcript_24905/g.59174  ORF Transcript_24905/g.59174 Transcript_24905/m.59174 type:complete len:358 (+) Transcript_24905:140-1213(+)
MLVRCATRRKERERERLHTAADAIVVRLTIIVAILGAAAAPSLCKHEGCLKHAQYGPETEKTRSFCSIHRHPHHVDQINAKCWLAGCSKGATFMAPDAECGQSCRTHRTEGMVPAKSWKPELRKQVNQRQECQEPGCQTQASYGDAATRERVACKRHRKEQHVSLKHHLCAAGCARRAYFGPDACSGEKSFHGMLLYCRAHKPANYVNVISPRCSVDACRKRPLPRTLRVTGTGSRGPGYCKSHLFKLRPGNASASVVAGPGDHVTRLSENATHAAAASPSPPLTWPWSTQALDLHPNPFALQSEALDRLPCAFCSTPIDDQSGFVLYPCNHVYHDWCASPGACWACNSVRYRDVPK